MAVFAHLSALIDADTRGFKRGMRETQTGIRTLTRGFQALAASAAVAGTIHLGKRLFELGSAAEETGSKFRTVLGPGVDEAQGFLDEFAAVAGLTNREGQELVATTAAMAQGMGLSSEKSRLFAQDVTKLAGDLSSFNNIPIEETSRAIQAAVTGEREQLKRLGIVIRETDVQKRALEETGKTNVKTLTDEEKATATLSLITQRAGVAVGDLARTQDSAANKARRLQAEFGTIRDGLATQLLPAFSDLLTHVQDSIPQIRTWADEWGSAIDRVLTHFATAEREFDPSDPRGLFGTGGFDRELIEGTKGLAGNMDALRARSAQLGGQFQVYRSLLTQASADTFVWDERMMLLAQHTNALEVAMKDANTRIREFGAAAGGTGGGDTGGGGGGGAAAGVQTLAHEIEFLEGLLETTFVPTINPLTGIVDDFGDASHLLAMGPMVEVSDATIRATLNWNLYRIAVEQAKNANDDLSSSLSKVAGKLGSAASILGFLGIGGPLGGFLGQGAGLFGAFGGLFQHGGEIGRGEWGIVGEAGPEIVRGPATVTPMGGGDIVLHVQLVTGAGQQVADTITVRQSRSEKLGHVVRVPVPVGVIN